jgi:hypothetical protein
MCRGAAVIQVAPAKELFERSTDQVFADVVDETERALGDISVIHMAIGADVGVSRDRLMKSDRMRGPGGAHISSCDVSGTPETDTPAALDQGRRIRSQDLAGAAVIWALLASIQLSALAASPAKLPFCKTISQRLERLQPNASCRFLSSVGLHGDQHAA